MKGTKEERLKALDELYPVWEEETLWTHFVKSVDRWGEREFLICGENHYTYNEIKKRADKVAKGLYAMGMRPGDHAAVFLHNSSRYLCLMLALAKMGVVKIPVNMGLGEDEKFYVLKQSEANWAIGIKLPAVEKREDLKQVRLINTNDSWDDIFKAGESIPDETIEAIEEQYRDPKGVCDILYTSGSTSFPKGVMLTHEMLLRSSYATCRTRLMEEGRRLFIPIPFYHIFAYNEGILPMMYVGGTIIISEHKFEPLEALELMKKYEANDIICVSFVMIQILSEGKPKPEDFPHMHAAYWASTCPEWVWDAGRKAFGITDVTTGYGMTECGSTSTLMSPVDPADGVKHYVGRLKDGGAAGKKEYGGHLIQLKICDLDTGEEVGTGKQGEILCRGLTVTPGYYKNEEANKKSFTEDGWFHTGDLGCFNEDGYLSFQGRKSDTYKINGENVSPQYVDIIIGQCPDVEQVEVVGIDSERYGEMGVAFIDAGEADEEKKERIKAYCRQKLARFQVPKYYVFESNENWPRTSTGKVQKRKLRERAQNMTF